MTVSAHDVKLCSQLSVWGFFKEPHFRMAQYLYVNIRGSVIVNSLEKINGGITAGQRGAWPFRLSVHSASTCQGDLNSLIALRASPFLSQIVL